MTWECSQCGRLAGQTEAEALEHGLQCGEPMIEPMPEPVPIEPLTSLTEQTERQTAALEVIAVQLGAIAKSLDRIAYKKAGWER
jgi:hypothetical protein